MADQFVDKDQLRIGMFVHLDLPWMKHPFMSSSFKIHTPQQLATIRKLKLDKVRFDPERSDIAPSTPAPKTEPKEEARILDDVAQAMWEEKKRRIQVLKERRVSLNRCAKRYGQSTQAARKLMSHLQSAPAQAAEEADDLACHMVDELAEDRDATVQLVNMKTQDENSYYHAVNVAALALVLGRSLALDRDQLRLLGMAALFHDLGHQQIPYKVLNKKSALSKPELQLYRQHPRYGAEMAARIGTLPRDVVAVIQQHHENLDGSGYPRGLSADAITAQTRIISVVNRYDNLCNGVTGKTGLSPYEAISRMYSRERQHYDPKVLNGFITNLGVYPPGSVVKLEDGRIAAVISINPRELLKPNVLLYNPDIPKEEALILDLREEELSICESLRLADLKPEVAEYLNLTDTVSYYFGPSGG